MAEWAQRETCAESQWADLAVEMMKIASVEVFVVVSVAAAELGGGLWLEAQQNLHDLVQQCPERHRMAVIARTWLSQ